MRKFLYSLRTDLIFSEPVKNHVFVLRGVPLVEPGQEPMRTSMTCVPNCQLAAYKDAFGNTVHQGYLEEPHNSFSFCSTGEVLIDRTKRDSTPPAPYYFLPSTMTKLSGGLKEFSDGANVSGTPSAVAETLLSMLIADFRYTKGVTTTGTTASEAWEIGGGVCQDFTHIMIALLRERGIAARYVAGLLHGEGASHAWLEYHDGNAWVGLDPTHSCEVNDTYMKISHGPDFVSCPLERGVFLGNGEQVMSSKCALIEI